MGVGVGHLGGHLALEGEARPVGARDRRAVRATQGRERGGEVGAQRFGRADGGRLLAQGSGWG